MSSYVIGDIQGCYDTLQALLARIGFDPTHDRLWLLGDLVNRGPGSLEVLRFARGLGDRVRLVLGNHDLHLLAVAAGLHKKKSRDTLDAILQAPDRTALLDWLAHQPLLLQEGDFVMVHAGIYPGWTLADAERRARTAMGLLRRHPKILDKTWRKKDPAIEEARHTLNVLTRMRCLDLQGRLALDFTDAPAQAPRGLVPWFEHPACVSHRGTILFGHWATLGLLQRPGLIGLDTGCVWGQTLTALRLDDGALWQQPNIEKAQTWY
jgi:bis(5'-nucleosyl)-tetraphosphatase (symmetrical)